MFDRSAGAARRLVWVAGTLALLGLSGCSRFDLFRPAKTDAYLSPRVCGVHVDGKTKEARLRIELVPRGLPRNALVEVEFENPAERSAPLVSSRVYKGDERTLEIFSPALKGVRPRGYEVVARIYSPTDKKQMLGVLTYVCQSLLDDRELGP